MKVLKESQSFGKASLYGRSSTNFINSLLCDLMSEIDASKMFSPESMSSLTRLMYLLFPSLSTKLSRNSLNPSPMQEIVGVPSVVVAALVDEEIHGDLLTGSLVLERGNGIKLETAQVELGVEEVLVLSDLETT